MKLRVNLFQTFIYLNLIIILVSCKKSDFNSHENLINTNTIEYKFFNKNRTTNYIEKNLVEYIERMNLKNKFVEETVSRIGYPYWDKMLYKKSKGIYESIQNNGNDSLQIFYIPFVKDSQNHVNASMVIRINSSDTSFSYVRDWEYKYKANDIGSAKDTAEHFAVFFMQFDKLVFGHSKFIITDTNLFKTNAGISKYIKLDSIVVSGVASNNLMVSYCQDVVYFVQNCQFPDSEQCRNGCDWCSQCVQSNHFTYCWDEYDDAGGGGGGGGTGGGTGGSGGEPGGGGGGTGGGTLPQECGGESTPFARNDIYTSNIIEPCAGGWEPVPNDEEPWWCNSLQHVKLAEKLSAILSPGDIFEFDNHITTGMQFQSVEEFNNFLSSQNLRVLPVSTPVIINQNEKIESQKFEIGLWSGIDVSCKVTYTGGKWIIAEVTSTEYGTVGSVWSWEHLGSFQNTSGTTTTLQVEGYLKYNLFLESIGTVYKKKKKLRIKINNQTGSIFEASIL